MELKEKNWLEIVQKEFDNPATVLWRAVEIRHIDNFLKEYNLEKPILDLGCAEGKIASILFNCQSAVGLDNSWELIKQNSRNDVYNALVLGDACKMPYKDSVFGSVFSNCVIEHIPEIGGLLKEVSRVLKQEGMFLFSVPSHKFADFLFFSVVFNNLGLKPIKRWYSKERNRLLHHFHCYSHEKWDDILKENGFELVTHDYYLPRKAIFIWDFLAVLWRFSTIILPFPALWAKINRHLRRFIEPYYSLDAKEGGALLLIARKNIT